MASNEKKKRFGIGLLLFVLLVLLALPYLILSDYIEPWVEEFIQSDWMNENPVPFSVIVVLSLISDLLLPVPSTFVCTLAGSVLGSLVGTIVCWCGLTLAAFIGYLLGRCLGPAAKRFAGNDQSMHETGQLIDLHGPWALALCRAIPLLAEASVIFVGIYRMNGYRFWPPILAANLGLAICYCVLGEIAEKQGWLGAALAVSLALPILIIFGWLAFRKRKNVAG